MPVVLVTGGSSGLGLATVRQLAASGHRVFAASRRPERAELPEGVEPLVLDVTLPTACQAAVAHVVEATGRLDVLVNVAGAAVLGSIEETSDEEAHLAMEVNLFGPMRLVRAAVPVMRAQGGGRIVNVTSVNDVLPPPFGGWYAASKSALASASVALAAEVHDFGIAVTVVAPGLFRTPMVESFAAQEIPPGSPYERTLRGMRAHNAVRLGRAGDPVQVAEAILRCVESDDPPARVVVGADAEAMASFVHDATPDELAARLRAVVAELAGRDPGGG